MLIDTITAKKVGETQRGGSTMGVPGSFKGTVKISRDPKDPCTILVDMTGDAHTFFQGGIYSWFGAPPKGANINYNLMFSIKTAEHKGHVMGAHDSYPSYRILLNGNQIYDFHEVPASGRNSALLPPDSDVYLSEDFDY